MSESTDDTSKRAWRCVQCGDDSGWSAALAEAERHLARAGVKIPADVPSAVDCCPDCFWELVTGKEPTPDLLPSMLRRGWGIDNVAAGQYGPHDDMSPGDENYVRQLEEAEYDRITESSDPVANT